MNKDVIKLKVREAINMLVEAPESTKQGNAGKKDYPDVRRAIEKLGGPSMVDVMKIMGTPNDEKGVNRSLFRKKVKQIKNKETGSIYQFDDAELPQVRAALDIQV
jgi:hypothetical protein